MRAVARWGCLMVVGLLASCTGWREWPGLEPSTPPQARIERCLHDLQQLGGLKFSRVPDRQVSQSCGFTGAVAVRDVGVPMTGLGPLSCPMAAGLYRWVREDLQPAARRHLGEQVTLVETYGSYACRARNNVAGDKPSEHSTANALDIAGVRTSSGRRVTVLGGWGGRADEQAFLRELHARSCRRFRVVLGPAANAIHRDHLHMDMGRGAYCR